MDIDPEIEIGDPTTEAGPRILIDSLEARKELERRNIPIDREETHEDSKSTMKTIRRTTTVAHEFPTKT